MANLNSYNKFFKYENLSEIHSAFVESLLFTNRTYDFFVGWDKARRNVEKYKVEIGILGSLVESKDFEKELGSILIKYPETAKIFPLLIAVRDMEFDVLEDISSNKVYNFNFNKKLEEQDIRKILSFVKKTGISELFKTIKVLRDYVLGVEVGLDTNARKNRSGEFMEKVIEGCLNDICKKTPGIEVFPKSKFAKLATKHNIDVPKGLLDRTPDFSVRKGARLLSIEVNFFSGMGSKPQEIVDSYINRQKELKDSQWDFAWITDGNGWVHGTHQLSKALQEMDYVMNISFVKKGFLEYVIKKL